MKRLTSPSGDASLDDAADLGIREGVRIFLVFKFGGDDERLPGCEMVPFLRLLGVRFFCEYADWILLNFFGVVKLVFRAGGTKLECTPNFLVCEGPKIDDDAS